MGHPTDNGVKHGDQCGVLGESAGTGSTAFNFDDQRQGLAASILLEVELLRNSIIREKEIIRAQGVDDFVGFVSD
jgi:hypothetical protein